MKKIERPDWLEHGRAVNKLPATPEDNEYLFTVDAFDHWFDKVIKPHNKLIESAVSVYARVPSGEQPCVWVESHKRDDIPDTHRAYLINIQPIKKETAEDVLRELTAFHAHCIYMNTDNEIIHKALIKRAKAVLESE